MIEAKHLTRYLGGRTLVDALSFEVRQGEVLGLLGPNGAGKTTTLKMLTGFVTPSSGTALIQGLDIHTRPRQAQRLIGYLPEGSPFYCDMTVLAFLEFIADVRNYRGAEKRQRVARVIDRLELASVCHQPIEALSKGYKRRVGLAQAILHEPGVLILDEPTDGLDPHQQQLVRTLIGELALDKRVIISTHQLDDVPTLCSHVMLIDRGRQVASGTPHALASRSRLYNAVHLAPTRSLDLLALVMLPGVARVEQTPGTPGVITVLAKPGAVIYHAIRQHIAEHQWPVERIEVERDCFAAVYRQLMHKESQ